MSRRRTRAGSTPKQLTCPAEGGIRPAIVRARVVLPAPLGPTTTTSSPGATSAVTSRSTKRSARATSTAVRLTQVALELRITPRTYLDLPAATHYKTGVRRRNDRVAMNLPVEVIADGRKLRAVSQDVSPFGMFVRLAPPLAVGTPVQVVMSPNGDRLTTTGQVTHVLTESEARTLGRFPGCGIVFREVMRPSDEAIHDAIVRM